MLLPKPLSNERSSSPRPLSSTHVVEEREADSTLTCCLSLSTTQRSGEGWERQGLDFSGHFCFSEATLRKDVMESLLGSNKPGLERARSYAVIFSTDLTDLEQKVSKLIDGGNYRLHGQPFVYRDQICQALALYNIGK